MNLFRSLLGAALVLGGASVVRAQAPAAPVDDTAILKYLAQRTAKVSERVLGGATTLEQWQQRRPRLKDEYFYMLGLSPLPEKTPLHAKVTGTLERDGIVVEKLHFQSRPGLYVTGNLYRPKKVEGKLPTVLYVCGHSRRGRNGNKVAFQDHGWWFANNGYVCLVIDTLQLGEVAGHHLGTYHGDRTWWHAAGYTPAGVEAWNGIRAIDYLVGRPDVDAERIAVTGISGGGAATFWIAAADERVKCAVPVSGMSDLESYVGNKVINGHCDCMFLVNAYGWEWTTIAALVAPRPLLFANSDSDALFPMDGNRRIIERLRTLYKLHGKPELVDEYVSKGGHDYRPDLRVAIFAYINKHIKNDTSPVKDSEVRPFKDEELRVFPTDEDLPKDSINGRADLVFVPRGKPKLPEEGQFEPWKTALVKELRERTFREFPERVPAAQPEKDGTLLTTEPGMTVRLTSIVTMKFQPLLGDVVVLNPGEDAAATNAWARSVLTKGGAPIYLEPRGVGASAWSSKPPPNTVARSHVLLGQTVDQRRVWDVASALHYRGEREKRTWRLIGRGPAGVLAAYAALFEPSIAEVVIVDPPGSHLDGPYFLNVLRVCDIPDALGLLAPRPLTLVNVKDEAFERTAAIYKRAGAEGKLKFQ